MSERTVPPAPTKGVAVELDRTRYLRYPLAVLKQLQSEGADKSLQQILLLGLQKDDPALTLEQLEDIVTLENMHVLFEPMRKATGGLIDLSRLFKGAQERPQTPAAGSDTVSP